jgi:hypothetical protein
MYLEVAGDFEKRRMGYYGCYDIILEREVECVSTLERHRFRQDHNIRTRALNLTSIAVPTCTQGGNALRLQPSNDFIKRGQRLLQGMLG